MNLEQTIFEMMTESTGRHFLDSGGSNGRHWQQNQLKTIDDFRNEPQAILCGRWADLEITVSLFHKLTSGVIELDDLCRTFNAEPMGNWNSDIYGVDSDQAEWLELQGFKVGDSWNTYNWDNNFSQILQGTDLIKDGDFGEEHYVLLQIHNGADARGGYTDAKLFKISDWFEPYQVTADDCGFSVEVDGDWVNLGWHGGWINTDGGCATDEDLAPFLAASKDKILEGIIYE